MTKDYSWKLQIAISEHKENMFCTFWHSEQFCTQHVLLMLWASEKDIPVLTVKKGWHFLALFGREILEVLAKVFFICKLESSATI